MQYVYHKYVHMSHQANIPGQHSQLHIGSEKNTMPVSSTTYAT